MNLQRAHDAAVKLQGNPDFEAFCVGLGQVAVDLVHSSLLATPENRIDSTAYARGVMEVYLGVEAARTGQNQRQIKPPKSAMAGVNA